MPPGVATRPQVRTAVVHQVFIPHAAVDAAELALGQLPFSAPGPRLLGVNDRLTQLIRLYMQEAASGLPADDPSVAALSSAVVYGLARAAPRGASADTGLDRRIRRALAAMASGYCDRLSVDDLAATARTQPSDDGHGYLLTPGISTDEHVTAWRLVADRVHAAGGRPQALR